jgi:hypothetical protein
MKSIGKIGVYIFLIFFLFFIGLLIQQVFGNEQMRPTWLTMVFSLMGPYLFTYSKWANDNIWNRKINKPKERITEFNEKDGEQVVRNFTNVILIILAIMLFVNIVSL